MREEGKSVPTRSGSKGLRRATSPVRSRKTEWFGFFGSTQLVGVNNTTVADLGSAIPDDLRVGATIVRIRGELLVASQDAPDDLQPNIWATCIMVANREAVAIGATALPDPGVDDGDYLWHRSGYQATPVDVLGTSGDLAARYIEIDNKSMRKMNESNKTIVFIFKNSINSNTSIRVGISTRILIKLH